MKNQEIFDYKKKYIENNLGPSLDYTAVFMTLAFDNIYNQGGDPKKGYIDLLLFMVENEIKPKVPFYSDFKLPWSDKPFFDQLKVKEYKHVKMAGGGHKAPKTEKRPMKKIGEPGTLRSQKPNNRLPQKKEIEKAISKSNEVKKESFEKFDLDDVEELTKTNMEKTEEQIFESNNDLEITVRTLKTLGLKDEVFKMIHIVKLRKLDLENELEMINKFLENHE